MVSPWLRNVRTKLLLKRTRHCANHCRLLSSNPSSRRSRQKIRPQCFVQHFPFRSLAPLFQLRQSGGAGEGGGAGGDLMGGLNTSTFVFGGNTNGASASDFTTGAKKLISGKFFTYNDYLQANPW